MTQSDPIPALLPDGDGHQFIIYGDSCSGRPDALHESTLASINAVIQRIQPPPEFICFPGDEISGLTVDEAELRKQWAYWFDHEMAWLDREAIPLYHTTGNHTTYNTMSEMVFREVMSHLPKNGPSDQIGLSYYVRRGDLLMIFVHTLWSGLGGEGNVETDWLSATLQDHADARHKLVVGHHPVFPVNGFEASYQREIKHETGAVFWHILVEHGVLAYVCSHILAFDVQVHQGVLQILTAGAGTAHRMPEGIEYLHALQVALDEKQLRYQVLDTDGKVREWLSWGWNIPASATWQTFNPEQAQTLPTDCLQWVDEQKLIAWQFEGQLQDNGDYSPQTLMCMSAEAGALPVFWVGISGRDNRLFMFLSPQPNRSPHYWHGPSLPVDRPFSIQFAIHSGMGPGGLLWRWDDDADWSSLRGASAWGVERLQWSTDWHIGHNHGGQNFRGDNLQIKWNAQTLSL